MGYPLLPRAFISGIRKLDVACNIAKRLRKDEHFHDRTTTPAEEIVHLTELCLKSTYFQYQEKFLEKTDGATMGSSLSPIIANIYMEHFKRTALDSTPSDPNYGSAM